MWLSHALWRVVAGPMIYRGTHPAGMAGTAGRIGRAGLAWHLFIFVLHTLRSVPNHSS